MEQRSRTLRFARFAEDAEDEVIKSAIKDRLKSIEGQIEDIYAYGKFSDGGAARFTQEDDMWNYLTEHAGDLNFEPDDYKIT